jgi:glutathione-independent formaldehyde dehydrogenase
VRACHTAATTITTTNAKQHHYHHHQHHHRYVTGDPGAVDEAAKTGNISTRIGLGWAKSLSFGTGQCPVMKYHRQLMNAILYDKVDLANWVNVEMITLDQAPGGYKDFDKGAAKKYVIDPHGSVSA